MMWIGTLTSLRMNKNTLSAIERLYSRADRVAMKGHQEMKIVFDFEANTC